MYKLMLTCIFCVHVCVFVRTNVYMSVYIYVRIRASTDT